MQSLISDYLFLILLILGGVIVAIRATELYSTPVPSNEAQWLNDEMHLRHLTGLRQYATGFIFYLMPVFLVYLLLSVSPELLSMSMGMAGTTNSVGALTLSGSDASNFAPLLAATAVITLFNVKPFSMIEKHLRRMAHGIAGIPQHIQDIIRQIRQLDFRSMTSNSPLRGIPLNQVQAVPGLDGDLAAIDTMNEWIFGSTGTLVWSDKATLAMQLSMHRVTNEYDTVKRKLVTMQRSSDSLSANASTVADEAMEIAVRHARELRISFTRLLAVLIANQDEHLSNRTPAILWALVTRTRNKRVSSHHFNTLAASTLIGIVISTPIVTLYNFTIVLINGLFVDGAALDVSNDALLIAGIPPDEFYWSSIKYAAKAAWWDVLGVGLIFFTGSTFALSYRAGRVNTGRWGLWHPRNHPVVQYVAVAILATIGAAFFYEVFLFFKLVVWPSLHVRVVGHFASMLGDFGRDYMHFGFLALLAAPSAVMACRLSDMMDSPSEYPTLSEDSQVRLLVWTVGGASMVIYLLLGFQLVVAHEISTLFLSAPIPSFTLFVMTASFWRIGELRPKHMLLLPYLGQGESDKQSGNRRKASTNT